MRVIYPDYRRGSPEARTRQKAGGENEKKLGEKVEKSWGKQKKNKNKKKKAGKSRKLEEEIGRGAKRENCTKGPPYFSASVVHNTPLFPHARDAASRCIYSAIRKLLRGDDPTT